MKKNISRHKLLSELFIVNNPVLIERCRFFYEVCAYLSTNALSLGIPEIQIGL